MELDETEIADGDDIIVDAVKGEIILKPSEEELNRYKEQVQKQEEEKISDGQSKAASSDNGWKRNTGISKYQQTNRHGKGSRVWMSWSRTLPDRVFIHGIRTAAG